MSRFEELARPKELDEATKNAPDWPCPVEDAVFCEAICDASPWLLKVAEAFQPGDAERLALLILNEQQRWTDDRWQAAIDCLRRLQAAAEELER